jgi:hypothetical protein
MTKRRSSLTGSWSGAYRYPDGAGETVFNAQVAEIGGAFTGATQEPQEIFFGISAVVTAEIEGVRHETAVSFTKRYDGSGGMSHAVRYEGSVDADLTRIEGSWTIPGDWSGTFFMTRDDDGETVANEVAIEVEK